MASSALARQIGRTLQNAGLSRAGAAGVLGNLQQESSINPNAPGGGLAQWIGPRQTALQRFAASQGKPVNDPGVQTSFLLNELKTQYPGLYGSLRSATDPRAAALAFSQQFERPGVPMNQNRESYAASLYGQLGGGGPGLPATTSPGGPSFSTSGPTVQFDQAAFDRAQQAATAGQYLAQSARGVSMWQAGPKSTVPAGANLFGPGLLTTTPPNRADYTTTHYNVAQTSLQGLAGGTNLNAHPASGSYPAGVVAFAGKPVAKWIAPILQYARQHGWRGSVSSGYRTLAQQTAIYNSGVRPAAVPGTSNHESDAFPGGAVDVTDAQQLSAILQRSPYASALVWAGAKDPVHFSHPHGGSY